MIKILYKLTGNTFTVPDEEAFKLVANNRGDFQILDGGLQKNVEEHLEPETVQELIMKKPEEVLEEEAKEQAKKEEKLDYSKLKKHELATVAGKLGITYNNTYSKAQLLEMIYKKIGK